MDASVFAMKSRMILRLFKSSVGGQMGYFPTIRQKW